MKKSLAKKLWCPFSNDMTFKCLVNDGVLNMNEGCMAWEATGQGNGYCKRIDTKVSDCISPQRDS